MMRKILGLVCVVLVIGGCASGSRNPFVSPSDPHAILDFRRPPGPFSPARLAEINGTNVNAPLSRTSFWVAPGEHEIVVIGGVDGSTTVSSPASSRRTNNPGRVTIEVEEGRRYFIAIQVAGGRSEVWEPVIYRVEDI
jgi:hypothetical protein